MKGIIMGYAKHVGRVGALAVALGIGAAVATTPGVAWAEGPDDSPPPSQPPASEPADSGTPDPSTPSTDRPEPGELIRRGIERTVDNVRKVVSGVVQSSGGAITSTHRTGSGSPGGNLIPEILKPRNAPENPQLPEGAPQLTLVQGGNDNGQSTFTPPRWRAPLSQINVKPGQKPVAKVLDDVKESVQQTITAVTDNQPRTGSTTVERNAISTFDAPTTEDEQEVRTGFVAPVAIITNVLNAALAPFLNTTPGQPAPQNPILWAVLGWVRRQVQDTPFGKIVLNRPPEVQAVLVDDSVDGTTFTISPAATDPDGDGLTYTATSRDGEGTLTPSDDGRTFTYTVTDEEWDGEDQVTITVSDAADYPHLHGLAGFFRPGGGHTDSITVAIETDAGPVVNDGTVINVAVGQVDLSKPVNVAQAQALDGDKFTLSSGATGTYHYNAATGVLTANVNPADANRLAGFFNPVQPSTFSTFGSMRMASFAAAAVAPTYDGFERLSVTVGDQTFDIDVPVTAARLQAGAPITVGEGPIAMAARGDFLYVLNVNAATDPGDPSIGTVSVIDTTTNQVVKTIATGNFSYAIVASGDRVYVANAGDKTITVINAITNEAIDLDPNDGESDIDGIALDRLPQPSPSAIAASEDGKRLYIINQGDGTVAVVSTETNALVDVVPAAPGSDPDDPEMDIDPLTVGGYLSGAVVSGKRLYVIDSPGRSVKVINIDEQDQQESPTDMDYFGQQVGGPIPVGNQASSIGVVTPPGAVPPEVAVAEVWVVNSFDGTITVIDTSNNQVTETIRLPSVAGNVVFSPDGSLAYVSTADQMTVIDTARHQVLLTTATDETPEGFPETVGLSADGSRIYAAHTISDFDFPSPPVYGNTVLPISFVTGGSNVAPTASADLGNQTTNPSTGVVRTTLTIDDFDSDALSVTVTPGAKGTAAATPNADGTYTITYTPSGQARLDAFDGVGDPSDTVTVVVTDGRGATSVLIPITIVPTAAAVTDSYDSPAGLHFARGLAVGPDGNVYVTFTTVDDEETFRVTLWNAATQSFVDDEGHVNQSGTGSLAEDVAVDGQGRVYVVNRTTNGVDVYDDGVPTPVDIGFGGVPAGLFTDSNGKVYAVVTEVFDPTPEETTVLDNLVRVSVYNVTDDEVAVPEAYTTDTGISLGNPFIKGVAASGGRFYITNPDDNTVVDTANPTAPIEVDGQPVSIAYDDATDRVYVTVSRPNATDPTAYDLVVVDVTSGSADDVGVVYTSEPGFNGQQSTLKSDMAVSADGSHIYVTNNADSTVTIMNAQTGVIEHTITIPEDIVGRGAPYRIAFSPDEDHVYVVDEQGKVSEISFADSAVNL